MGGRHNRLIVPQQVLSAQIAEHRLATSASVTITYEHRHRLPIKATASLSENGAGNVLGRYLQSALQVVQSTPESISLENKRVLLRLLTDLQEQIQTHSA